MQGLHIVSTASALPKKIVTNDDLSKIVETSDEWIRTRTGICTRYMCEEETCTSLAIEAGRKAIDTANIDVNEIGVVIVATATSDYAFPSTACLVSKALGLPHDVAETLLIKSISLLFSTFFLLTYVSFSTLSTHPKDIAIIATNKKYIPLFLIILLNSLFI